MSGGRYAQATQVTPSRSMEEIQKTLRRYGAEEFVFGQRQGQGALEFVLGGRRMRMVFDLPGIAEVASTPTGRRRKVTATEAAHEQAVRQRWRALALVVKAKLEAVESGIATLEGEFLAYIVLPTGETIGQWALPRMARGESLPSLLPGEREIGGGR